MTVQPVSTPSPTGHPTYTVPIVICVWNSTSNPNINGLYTYQSGTYQLNRDFCTPSTYYIYESGSSGSGYWVIATALNSFDWIAECITKPNNQAHECSSWNIPITVSLGACPSLQCTEIIISDISGHPECSGTYQYNMSPNQYWSIKNGNYIYFHEPSFKWYCTIDTPNSDTCDIPTYKVSSMDAEWYDLTYAGDSFKWNTDVGMSVTMTCSSNISVPDTTNGGRKTFCVWNALANASESINGEYVSYGIISYNGYLVYRLQLDAPCNVANYYLFFSMNRNSWAIAAEYNEVQSITPIIAYCATFASNPQECNGYWSLPGMNVSKSCPTLQCNSIDVRTEGLDTECAGTYYPVNIDNTYRNDKGVYLYFNSKTFSWYCGHSRFDTCEVKEYLLRNDIVGWWSGLTYNTADLQVGWVEPQGLYKYATTVYCLEGTFSTTTTTSGPSDELCVWNAQLDSGPLNGRYKYASVGDDGFPIWIMQIDDSCGVSAYSIFRNPDTLEWIVSDDYYNSNVTYAECHDLDYPDHPSLCMDWTVDGMEVFDGPCPVTQCSDIELNNAGGCSGVFKRYQGQLNIFQNVYEGVTNKQKLYFDQYTFSWKCSSSYIDTICGENSKVDIEGMDHVWYDIAVGQTYNWPLLDGKTATITCLDSIPPTPMPVTSNPPTPMPVTSIPPTPMPVTSIPTHMPTPTFTGICVWGLDAEQKINGNYAVNVNKFNQRSSYRLELDPSLDCGVSGYVVFFSYQDDGKWTIARSFESYPIAYCTMDRQPLSPDECNGKWSLSGIWIGSSGCPILSCDELIIDNSELCSGTFVKMGSNVYLSEDGSKYLYFSQHLFSWICSTQISYSCNNDMYIERYVPAWALIYNNETTEMRIVNGTQVNMTCIGGAEKPPITTIIHDIYEPTHSDSKDSRGKFSVIEALGITTLQLAIASGGTVLLLCICLGICFCCVFKKRRKRKDTDKGKTIAFGRISVKSTSRASDLTPVTPTTDTPNTTTKQLHGVEMVSMTDIYTINSDITGMSEEGDIILGGVLINAGATNSPGGAMTPSIDATNKTAPFDRYNTEELYSGTDNNLSLTPRGSNKQNMRFSSVDEDELKSMQVNTLQPPQASKSFELKRFNTEDLYSSPVVPASSNISTATPQGSTPGGTPGGTPRPGGELKSLESEMKMEVREMKIPDIPKEIHDELLENMDRIDDMPASLPEDMGVSNIKGLMGGDNDSDDDMYSPSPRQVNDEEGIVTSIPKFMD